MGGGHYEDKNGGGYTIDADRVPKASPRRREGSAASNAMKNVVTFTIVVVLVTVLALTLVRQRALNDRVDQLDSLCEEYRETLCVVQMDTSSSSFRNQLLHTGSFTSQTMARACGKGASDQLAQRTWQCEVDNDVACVRRIANQLMQAVPMSDEVASGSIWRECSLK